MAAMPVSDPSPALDPQRLDELAAADRALRIYLDYFEKLRTPSAMRVAPEFDRAAIDEYFVNTLGAQGVGMTAMLQEFAEEILPRSMATPHPGYMGLVNSSPLPAAPLADLLVSLINNNGGARHQSPSAYAAEAEVVRCFSEICYADPNKGRGLVLPGGSYANLQGMLLARQRQFPRWRQEGPQCLSGQPRVYTASGSHFSVARSAEVVGLGASALRQIDVCGRGSMDADALASAIRSDKAAGEVPFLVVATAGTTGTGAIDPLAQIAEICRTEGLWLHVDACYGGAARLLDPPIAEMQALPQADSIAIDPHKWFFMPVTSALFLCRHPQADAETFDFAASYIPHADPVDGYRRSIPSSRRASALTVWMALRAHGMGRVQEAVAANIDMTRRLERGLASAGFRVLPGGQLSIANARFEPPGRSEAELERLQSDLAQACVASGKTWFATVRHAGQTWLRFNPVNLHLRSSHVDEIVDLVAGQARALA